MALLGGLEILIIKGISYIATHVSASAAAHFLSHLAAYAVSHGVITTAVAIATNPIVIGGTAIIGGIAWTQEKANHVNEIVKALGDDDAEKAGKHLLALSGIFGKAVDETAGIVVELLDEKYDRETVKDVSKTIRTIASEIKKNA